RVPRASWRLGAALMLLLALRAGARADTLVFVNGDEVSGTLVRADSAGCVFRSDMAGEVNVAWSHVRELRTVAPYIVVERRGQVVEGRLLADGSTIEISSDVGGATQYVAANEARMIVDPKTYVEAVTAHPAPWQAWRGLVSGGFSQVSATQSSTNYTTQIELQRPVPALSWLPQQANTLLHFQGTYGKLSQPGQPTVRTSIFTAGVEQDEDVSARLFGFGNAQLDHNLAQGLELQQAYGGGIGWKLIESGATHLDLKADLHWTHQRFLSAAPEQFLASSFTESLRQSYGRVIWTQSVSLTPSYTNGLAYQMSGLSSWAVPLYHAFSLNFTVVDNYLNNPQHGFLRNSLQYSTGLQFTLQ
ncbi:MAG: DUF481 domain-containing protein, partial [Terriglobales bacterium]